MRPTRLVLFLAALLLLAPVSALAGKGGGGDLTGVLLDDPVEGDYFFLDKISVDKIKSIASVDQKANEICVSGIATFNDTTATLNKRVEWEFISIGDIEKQGPGKVDGLFTSVDLRLTVFDGPETTDAVLFDSTVLDAPCELDAKLSKIGVDQGSDPGVGDDVLIGHIKADLTCELDPFLTVMGKVPEDVLGFIETALAKKKTIKIRIQTGDFQINNKGFRVDPVADQLDFTALSCAPAPPPPK